MFGKKLSARDLALVAVFAALIAALGVPGAIPLTSIDGAAPITFQTLGVMLAGSLLGARRGALAVTTFLVLVAAGLPLLPFSATRPQGGLAVFSSGSAGFLLSWILAAFVIGLIAHAALHRFTGVTRAGLVLGANIVGGLAIVYAIGVPWMAQVANMPRDAALTIMAGFVPGDLIKAIVATVVTLGVAKGYPAIVGRQDEAPAATSPQPTSSAS